MKRASGWSKILGGTGPAAGRALSAAILFLVSLAAVALSPWRTGRLLRSVSLPHLRERSLRSTLTVLGVALGVATIVAVGLLNRSILSSFSATIEEISGKADLQVTASGGPLYETQVEQIRAVPGVARASPVIQETVVIQTPEAREERLLVIGVDLLGDDRDFRRYDSEQLAEILEDPIPFMSSPRNLILGRRLAARLGYRLHDRIPLATPGGVVTFEVWGYIEDRGIGRAFGGAIAVMDYQSMQAAFKRGTTVDWVEVAVDPGRDPGEVARALVERLGPGFSADPPERRSLRASSTLAGLRTGLAVGSLIALLVGMFLIYNTMTSTVVQRRREIGILRALGATRHQVLALFTLEAALLGIAGSFVGLGLGVELARVMIQTFAASVSEVYIQVAASEVHTDPLLLGGGLALGLLAAVTSSLIPAGEATGVQPGETLRSPSLRRSPVRGHGLRRGEGLALALLAASAGLLQIEPVKGQPIGAFGACLAIVMGSALLAPRIILGMHRTVGVLGGPTLAVERRLATQNLPRHLRRTAVTSAALMVGVAMGTSLAAFLGSFQRAVLQWVDQSVPADLFVTSSAPFPGVNNVPIGDVLYDQLSLVPGVSAVERLRVARLNYAGTPVKIVSLDVPAYVRWGKLTFVDGDPRSAVQAMLHGQVLVSENLARRHHLHAGAKLELATPAGARSFSIAGIVVDYTSDQGTIFFDRAIYIRHWGDSRVDTYKLHLAPEADLEAARRLVDERYARRYNLFVLTNREYRAEIRGVVRQGFSIMHALEGVAVLIALLGVVNALLANVLDRVRELGVLRAVGMLRRQVRRTVMIEAGLLGLASVASGVATGLVLGYIQLAYINFANTGWYFPYRPAFIPIAELAALVLGAALGAGYYPAGQAAALPVTKALQYE